MKTLIIILGIVVIVGAGVGAVMWAMDDQEPKATEQADSKDTTSESDDAAATSEEAAAVTITYTDSGFSTSADTVKAGETILVINESSETLQFSSDPHPQHTDNSELNLPTLQPGEQETMVVNESGRWGFHNHLNDDHSGSITVTD